MKLRPLSPSPLVRRRVLAVVAAVALITLPVAVLAAHRFSDVPTTHPFHTEISNLAGSGVTLGCGGGKYCPSTTVDRGQMAAFLNRGLGRAALGSNAISVSESDTFYVTGLELATGGATGGAGFVTLTGSVTVEVAEPGVCPCDVLVWVDAARNGMLIDSSAPAVMTVADTASPTGFRSGTATVTWVTQVTSGEDHQFALAAEIIRNGTPGVTSESYVGGTLTATYSAFGSTGGSTLEGAGAVSGTTLPVHRGEAPDRVGR